MRSLVIMAVLAAVGFSLTGCAGQQAAATISQTKPEATRAEIGQRSLLIGTWFSESPTDAGGWRRALSKSRANGGFEITFQHTSADGEIEVTHEFGIWGLSGGIYFVSTLGWVVDGKSVRADRTDGYFDDAYRVISLTADAMEYEHIATGNRYIKRRVADDFVLPRN